MKMLTANTSGVIDGTVSKEKTEAPKGGHKYRVFYKNVAAGPDPEIEVDCGGCGPGPGPPEPPGRCESNQ